MGSKDLFMNIKSLKTNFDAIDSSTIVEEAIATGLSIRGALIWLLHKVEIIYPRCEVDATVRVALSTVSGLTGIPSFGDKGTIWKGQRLSSLTTSGFPVEIGPHPYPYLPPIPIASPNISLYLQTAADVASLQGAAVNFRLLFTTAPLTAAVYTEIAETWGW